MNILFVTKTYYPRLGGVEKQVSGLAERLVDIGHTITLLTLKYDDALKDQEIVNGVKIIRIRPPQLKYYGLIYMWLWFIFHLDFFKKFEIIHFHGNLIWYWPLRLILFYKPVYVTFHGWEGIYPVPLKNIVIKKIDSIIATRTIAISDYLQKHYFIKAHSVSYTAVDTPRTRTNKKEKRQLLYVGRLDKDTGLPIILKALSLLKGFKVDFCGDGLLRKECAKYGTVHGFVNPDPFYRKANICLSPGISSILEGFAYKCLVVTAYNNPLKKDYLLMNPFSNWIVVNSSPDDMARAITFYTEHPEKGKLLVNKCYQWVKAQNWDNEINKYLKLWDQH
jgi:glycosyltransferase involved in cell wall biosynthesis